MIRRNPDTRITAQVAEAVCFLFPERVAGAWRAGVGISGRAGSAEGGEARPKREDLFGAVPLCADAGQANREEAGVNTTPGGTRRFL